MSQLETKATCQKYSAYKESGVEWLGQIPEGWEIIKLGGLLKSVSEKNYPSLPLLSITREKGVIVRDVEDDSENHNFIPDDLTGYKLLEKGQFGMNKMKAWQGSYGVSPETGIVSPAYYIFDFTKPVLPRFFHLAIRSKRYISYFGAASDGVRIGQWDLSKDRMKKICFFLPSIKEQTAIANFLDEKTAKIDQTITQKERLIALLKERKQIIIQNAVTGKWSMVNGKWSTTPKEKMKDSGVEWIGEILEHWEVKRLKYVSQININSLTDNTPAAYTFDYVDIGSVSFENGIEKTESLEFKYSPSRARRIAKEGDTVISTVRTYLKAIDYVSLEKSNFIYSTGFAVLTPVNIQKIFLYHFVRSNAFTEQVTVDSKGMSYPAINSTDLSRLILAIPPFEEQNKIVHHIETQSAKMDQSITLQQTQIEKLKEYKASLIDSAVTGKLRVPSVQEIKVS